MAAGETLLHEKPDSLEQVITKRIILGEWSKHFTAFVWTYTLIQGASKVSEWLYICLTI